jgi:hypothetical protein
MANLVPEQVPTVNEIQVYRQKSSTTELDVLCFANLITENKLMIALPL